MSQVRQAVITVAGLGTRFLPASKAVPKEMTPIMGKPLIQYHVEELAQSGIEDIILVVRGGSEAFLQHFAADPALEAYLERAGKTALAAAIRRIPRLANIVYVYQSPRLPYGNASPALAAKPWLAPGEPFFYMFGDDLVLASPSCAQQLLDAFARRRPLAVSGVHTVAPEEASLYGIYKLKEGSDNVIASIVEKPAPGAAPSNLAQIGRFVFDYRIFQALEGLETGQGGELWLSDAVDRLAQMGEVVAQPIAGRWLPAGDPLRHLFASIETALSDERYRRPLLEYLRALPL